MKFYTSPLIKEGRASRYSKPIYVAADSAWLSSINEDEIVRSGNYDKAACLEFVGRGRGEVGANLYNHSI